MSPEERKRLIAERDDLPIPEQDRRKFGRLRDAGWGEHWISPIQETSHDPTGPVVMGSHWLDVEGAEERRADVEHYGGYLPDMPFNRVLDLALWHARLTRRDIYITQACHLMPLGDGNGPQARVPPRLWRPSFDRVTRYEIGDRPVLALGAYAQEVCRRNDVRYLPFPHPGGGARTPQSQQAKALAAGLEWALKLVRPSHGPRAG